MFGAHQKKTSCELAELVQSTKNPESRKYEKVQNPPRPENTKKYEKITELATVQPFLYFFRIFGAQRRVGDFVICRCQAVAF